MAQIIESRRMFWDSSTSEDVEGYNIYVEVFGQDDFLARVDAGQIEPHVVVESSQWTIAGLDEGDYQFAVAAVDDAGNISDPYQHPAWASVPLDLTPPMAPSGGGLE